MDTLSERIDRFLSVGDGDGDGDGDGYGYGDGDGYGYGYGYGDGYGYGYGNGYGNGDGDGDGNGYGNGDGDGYGNGYGNGILEFEGQKLHKIDGVPTAITSVRGNFAKGFVIEFNSVKKPCFIAKVDNYFAHGETLRKAVEAAMAKAFMDKPLNERIAATVKAYPDPSKHIPNADLFRLHHVLTGSCEMGRRQFCQAHGISLDDSMTMADFIKATCNDYGRDAIRQLADNYGIKITNQ